MDYLIGLGLGLILGVFIALWATHVTHKELIHGLSVVRSSPRTYRIGTRPHLPK